jgi:hypothetical protein
MGEDQKREKWHGKCPQNSSAETTFAVVRSVDAAMIFT